MIAEIQGESSHSLTHSTYIYYYRLSATTAETGKGASPCPQRAPSPAPAHCLELNSEGLYNQRGETHHIPQEPLKKVPDSQVASETSSGSGKVPFLSSSTPPPNRGRGLLKAALTFDRDKCWHQAIHRYNTWQRGFACDLQRVGLRLKPGKPAPAPHSSHPGPFLSAENPRTLFLLSSKQFP